MSEAKGLGKFLLIIVAIIFLFKLAEPSGPRPASAVGSYTANEEVKNAARDIVKNLERYQAPTPYKCKTTSWDGPYKHDGRTYSTVCN